MLSEVIKLAKNFTLIIISNSKKNKQKLVGAS